MNTNIVRKIERLENELFEYHGFDTTTLQQELDIIDYSWSLALEDLENMGVDTDLLAPWTYFAYDYVLEKEITDKEYLERLERLHGLYDQAWQQSQMDYYSPIVVTDAEGEEINITRKFVIEELTWVTTHDTNYSLIKEYIDAVDTDDFRKRALEIKDLWENAYGEKTKDLDADSLEAHRQTLNQYYWDWIANIKQSLPIKE